MSSVQTSAALVLLTVVGCTSPTPGEAERSPIRETQAIPQEQPPARASSPEPEPEPELTLVASRNGDIEFHRAWDQSGNERMILVATLPYPFVDGALQILPGLYDGLIDPGEDASLDVSIAGGFFAADDGWLTLSTDPGMPNYTGIPLTYQWKAPGWKLLRERHGRFTQLHSHYITRGSTVFAQTYDVRLATPYETLVVVDPASRRGAPASKLVRLRGPLPEPELIPGASWATSSTGAIYQIVFVPESDSDEERVELLDWAPEQATPRSTSLPDTVPLAKHGGFRVQLTATERGVLITGKLPIEGHPEGITYLAVGQPGALTRLAIECDGGSCGGVLTSAAIGPDGDYWLAIDGSLHSLDSRGVARPQPLPELRVGHSVEHLRKYPAKLEDIERIGDDLWLRLVSSSDGDETITAVYKTGASAAPVVLPSRGSIRAEIVRRQYP